MNIMPHASHLQDWPSLKVIQVQKVGLIAFATMAFVTSWLFLLFLLNQFLHNVRRWLGTWYSGLYGLSFRLSSGLYGLSFRLSRCIQCISLLGCIRCIRLSHLSWRWRCWRLSWWWWSLPGWLWRWRWRWPWWPQEFCTIHCFLHTCTVINQTSNGEKSEIQCAYNIYNIYNHGFKFTSKKHKSVQKGYQMHLWNQGQKWIKSNPLNPIIK